MRKNGAKKWPLGFGALYVMVHFPFLIFTKIGITGKTVKGRAAQIDEAVFGFPIPIMVVFIPFCYAIEQFLHTLFSPLNVRFYRGDGHTEWFLAPAGIFVGWLGLQYWYGLYHLAEYLINNFLS